MYPMENQRHVPTSVSRLKTVIRERKPMLDKHCDLLAQKIDMIATLPDMIPVRPEERQLDLFMAMATLNAVSGITQEYDIFRISPVSIRIEGCSEEILNDPEIVSYEKCIFERLYNKSSVIRRCMDLYIASACSVKKGNLITSGVKNIPPIMERFSRKKNWEEGERERKDIQEAFNRHRDCSNWFPSMH